MASRKEFLEYILEQLSELEEITYRAMMGEYIIYYKGRIAGGIYDDRLLIKPVKSAIDYVSDIRYEVPYEGAKEMILIEEVDNKEYLTELFKAIYDDLPTPKKKKITTYFFIKKAPQTAYLHYLWGFYSLSTVKDGSITVLSKIFKCIFYLYSLKVL